MKVVRLYAVLACAMSSSSLLNPVDAFSAIRSSSQVHMDNNRNKKHSDVDRREVIQDIVGRIGGIISILCGYMTAEDIINDLRPANAANLPVSTGADMSRTGTIDTLIPIIKMENALLDAKKQLSDARAKWAVSSETIKSVFNTLSGAIPSEQTLFKRKFDEYSDPVSYKQKFMDQNAFLVYYTKGFDGPNRPPMEASEDPVPRQTLQYGLRNDAWTAIDNLFAELSFYLPDSSNVTDILDPLDRAIAAFEAYFSCAPADDVEEARLRVLVR